MSCLGLFWSSERLTRVLLARLIGSRDHSEVWTHIRTAGSIDMYPPFHEEGLDSFHSNQTRVHFQLFVNPAMKRWRLFLDIIRGVGDKL